MSKNKKISDEDINLFREAVKDTLPLRQDKFVPEKSKPKPRPSKTEEDQRSVMEEIVDSDFDSATVERGDELLFHRPGLQKLTLRKLRRGQFSIEDELDLHGMKVEEARAALSGFIKHCQSRNKRCVRIVHGKGLGSANKFPVIKNKVNNWLQKREEVMAFCSARPIDGGTGAIYLLLKRK